MPIPGSTEPPGAVSTGSRLRCVPGGRRTRAGRLRVPDDCRSLRRVRRPGFRDDRRLATRCRRRIPGHLVCRRRLPRTGAGSIHCHPSAAGSRTSGAIRSSPRRVVWTLVAPRRPRLRAYAPSRSVRRIFPASHVLSPASSLSSVASCSPWRAPRGSPRAAPPTTAPGARTTPCCRTGTSTAHGCGSQACGTSATARDGTVQPAFEERTYDLDRLESVWFVLVPFSTPLARTGAQLRELRLRRLAVRRDLGGGAARSRRALRRAGGAVPPVRADVRHGRGA